MVGQVEMATYGAPRFDHQGLKRWTVKIVRRKGLFDFCSIPRSHRQYKVDIMSHPGFAVDDAGYRPGDHVPDTGPVQPGHKDADEVRFVHGERSP
jgi:hypothetical protein